MLLPPVPAVVSGALLPGAALTHVPPLCLALGVALTSATPSGWTHRFGALTGAGAATLTASAVLITLAARRFARDRVVLVASGLRTALAACATALASAGENDWFLHSQYGVPWGEQPVRPLDSPAWWLVAVVVLPAVSVLRGRSDGDRPTRLLLRMPALAGVGVVGVTVALVVGPFVVAPARRGATLTGGCDIADHVVATPSLPGGALRAGGPAVGRSASSPGCGGRRPERGADSVARRREDPRVLRTGTPVRGQLPDVGQPVRRSRRSCSTVGLARGVTMADTMRQQVRVPVPQQRPHRRDPGGPRLVSYVLPVFNEVDGIRHFHEELTRTTDTRPEFDYEFVYVNDGSDDGSLDVLRDIAKNDPRVRVVDFARNYGHQIAITAGLDHAQGDAVIVMDTDLQDPPRVSLELIDAWVAGAEIVSARRRTRRDTPFKRATAAGYYRLLRRCAEVDIPVDTGDFRLLDRRAAEELRKFRERSRFIRGMVASMGFEQREVLFDRDERVAGETKYPMRKMLRLAADGVTGFSTVPLKMITRMGFITLGLALLGIIYAVTLRLFFPAITVSGWTMLMVAMLFLGGMQMLSLGVIGSYVGRIYSEVQQRPLYIVRDVIRHDAD